MIRTKDEARAVRNQFNNFYETLMYVCAIGKSRILYMFRDEERAYSETLVKMEIKDFEGTVSE